MTFALLAAVMCALFAACRWGGGTLAGHYQDAWELAAVAAMGGSAVGALWLMRSVAGVGGALPTAGMIGAAAGGLFLGYLRAERD